MMIKNKVLFLSFFLLMALLQLYIPASLVLQQERILSQGALHKFKTAPIDPVDPFRGKYVTLNFNTSNVAIQNIEDWQPREEVFIFLKKNKNGFTQPVKASQVAPSDNTPYLKTTVRRVAEDKLYFDYPFRRYYMEESKAPKAEYSYFEANRDSSITTYAQVRILNGQAVLEDVIIGDQALSKMFK